MKPSSSKVLVFSHSLRHGLDPGYEPISFDVLITPNEMVTYKGELRRIQ